MTRLTAIQRKMIKLLYEGGASKAELLQEYQLSTVELQGIINKGTTIEEAISPRKYELMLHRWESLARSNHKKISSRADAPVKERDIWSG